MAYETTGAGVFGTLYNAGVPGAGTNETQTATIASYTGGTFKLIFDGWATEAITWSTVTNTLLANINAKLDLLPNGGTSWIVATDVALSSGNGTFLLTFSGGDLKKKNVALMTADVTGGTGTGRSISIATTTPGVTAFGRDANPGTLVIDVTNKIEYIDTGTLGAPTWTKVGTQT